jgi:hypothetical protein
MSIIVASKTINFGGASLSNMIMDQTTLTKKISLKLKCRSVGMGRGEMRWLMGLVGKRNGSGEIVDGP